MVPISFVSEHIETLEEIDGEYRELAEENGIEWWERVPYVSHSRSAGVTLVPSLCCPPCLLTQRSLYWNPRRRALGVEDDFIDDLADAVRLR